MVEKSSKYLPRAQARIILFCPDPKGHRSGIVVRGLLKTEGIKGAEVNPLTHNIEIRYDPNKVTVKDIRSILKKLHSDPGPVGKKRRRALSKVVAITHD